MSLKITIPGFVPAKIPSENCMEQLDMIRRDFDLRIPSADFLHTKYFPYDKRMTRALLHNKHVMMIGDSLTRGIYKDLLSLIQDGQLPTHDVLKRSNEDECFGDRQIDILPLEANRVFRQAREFQSNRHLIQFFFTSRVMREDLEKTLLMVESFGEIPDIVLVNSAIWDVSRFRDGYVRSEKEEEIETIDEYLQRLSMFCRRMRTLLPPQSMLIWMSMPPVTQQDSNLSSQVGFVNNNRLESYTIRMRTLEAEMRAAAVVREAGFDVLDFSFHMRGPNYHLFRTKDGVHWSSAGVRFMSQLLLGHIASAYRLDQTFWKKSHRKVQESTEYGSRSSTFTTALDLLKKMNVSKQKNECAQQALRQEALQKLDKSGFEVSNALKIMRRLFLFNMHYKSTKNEVEKFVKVYGREEKNLTKEIVKYSIKDLQELRRNIRELVEYLSREGKMQKMIMLPEPSNKRKADSMEKSPDLSDMDIVVSDEEKEEWEEKDVIVVDRPNRILDPEPRPSSTMPRKTLLAGPHVAKRRRYNGQETIVEL